MSAKVLLFSSLPHASLHGSLCSLCFIVSLHSAVVCCVFVVAFVVLLVYRVVVCCVFVVAFVVLLVYRVVVCCVFVVAFVDQFF